MKVSELRFDATPDSSRFHEYRREHPLHLSIAQMISAQAANRGQAIAVRIDDQAFTYEELEQEANRYARLLTANGIGHGSYVAIMLERSWNLVAALVGVLKAGCVYVPVHPALSRERIYSILRQTPIRATITQARYLAEAQTLLWAIDSLAVLLCADSQDWREEPAAVGARMSEGLWDHVADTAQDIIAAGGWKSVATGQWLSREVMSEYAGNAAEKILSRLNAASRVLEIGCGSGITLLRIAPNVGFYCGTDLSRRALDWAERECKAAGLSHVEFRRMTAHEPSDAGETFDAVILNSVVQSFPGLNYLHRTLARAIERLRDHGSIFLGSLWDVERREQAASGVEGFFVSRAMIEWICGEFPEIASVEFSPIRSATGNELAAYSFDAVLTIDKTAGGFRAEDRERLKKILDRRDLASTSCEAFQAAHSDTDVAYVIFTSGSTGQPKGVEVEMRSLVNLCCWYREFVRIGEGTAVIQTIPISFDAPIKNFLAPLIAGGTVVLLNDGPYDPAALLECICRFQVEVINPGVPSVLYPMVDLAARSGYAELASLRCLALGGEPMNLSKLAHWLTSPNCRCRVTNIYGPTECTDITLCYKLTTADIESLKPPPIGRPIHNMEFYVLDADGRPEPTGVVGELCIAGVGLARGYVGDSDLTKQKFVACPFGEGGRMYRTGDLVRELDSGDVMFVGRADRQLKIRGHRIEPGDIEAHLQALAGVVEAAVDVREDGTGAQFLCAYVAGPSGTRAEWLRGELERMLPEYMIPSRFFALEQLPTNRHGKVDRQALTRVQSTGELKCIQPRTPLEERLKKIWQQVLGLGDIGVTENFFSVGGHSLKTVALSVEVNRELGLELPITAIYLSQTIEQQAAFLSNRTGALPQFVHRLNPSGSPLLFCFPPITGFAWSYASLARRVTEYNIYGFDFIEDADRITLYADTIQAIAKGAAVRLCGYSAGGTLAFLVAKEIESRGGSVRKLLLLDANRAVERSGYSDADIESTLRECLSDPRLRIYVAGEREKEQLSKRVRDYGAFLANTCCIGQVHAEIELLLAYPPAQDLIDKWRNASTQSFRYWNAEGSHNELLDSHNLDRNGPLIAQALGAGQPKTYEAMAR